MFRKKNQARIANPGRRYQQNKTKRRPIPKFSSVRKQKRSGLFKVIFWLLILATGLYLIQLSFFSNFFRIKNVNLITVGGPEEITENIKNLTDGAKGLNLILLDGEKISDKMMKIHSDIEKIEVKKNFPDSLEIKIFFHPELVNFMIEKSPSGEPHKFVVTESGLISRNYHENPELPYLQLRNTTDEIFDEILGEKITFEPENLKKAILAKTLFESTLNMAVIENNYYKTERETRLKTEKGFYVWLDLTKDIESQILKLKKALPQLDINNEPLLYIDLRIGSQNGEKIIFKRLK